MLALIFPGQGSQSLGMLKALSEQFPQVLQRFQEASDIIGKDLWTIVQENPDDQLNHTIYTQPILLTASYAAYEVLQQELAISPQFLVGHSLGEYSALTVAGALTFAEAVALVHQRGSIMQEAVPFGEGAMAAILGLEDKVVREVCSGIEGGEVYPANYNSPGQVVIGGKKAAVDAAIVAAKAAGAKRAVLLPVSVPSHTPLMRSAAAKFSLFLDQIHWQEPKISVIFNVDAKQHKDRYGIQAALGAQLYEPVLWTDCITALGEAGVNKVIEVGPGKVLSGLAKRIDNRISAGNFDSPDQLEGLRSFLEQ